MNRYEVYNPESGHSFGIYKAETREEAIEEAVRDAGYKSIADMLDQLGETTCDLEAWEIG